MSLVIATFKPAKALSTIFYATPEVPPGTYFYINGHRSSPGVLNGWISGKLSATRASANVRRAAVIAQNNGDASSVTFLESV